MLSNADGAYVNVACIAASEALFKNQIKVVFDHHNFEIFEIEDIELATSMEIDDEESAEKVELVNELTGGVRFAWGTFHAFDE